MAFKIPCNQPTVFDFLGGWNCISRHIYHCPFCNLCRVGKGLGIDYFHCMTCNSCMSKQLKEHVCREKGLESNCPICHDFLFTSNTPFKALPCGHFMHSACFQVSLHFSTMIILVSCQKGLTLCEWHSYNGMTTLVVLPSNCCWGVFTANL